MRIAIIYGGKSDEHQISIRSVPNIYNIIKFLGHKLLLFGMTTDGKCYLQSTSELKNNKVTTSATNSRVAFAPGEGFITFDGEKLNIDCVFPLIHGAYGEDGRLQGALEIAGIPYVGENNLTSAICMDKSVTKIFLQNANIPTVPSVICHKHQEIPSYKELVRTLGEKLVVKPASSGSSIGVSCLTCSKKFKRAIDYAFKYDNKILIEKHIAGREISSAVFTKDILLGCLGEIKNLNEDIYSFDEKYINKTAILEIPAKLTQNVENKILMLSIECFKILQCKSMARIDFFVDGNDRIYVNEINTIPALSESSLYPRLIESKGISQDILIKLLLEQAMLDI